VAFRKLAQTGQIGKAVIVGGGFIGCELTEATASLWGIETVLIERENQILPYVLDADMAGIAQREMARQDIDVHTGATVEKIELDDDENPVVYLAGGDTVTADYIFLCLGVTPTVELAREAGLDIGSTGAIKVDEHMRTSDADIYAGGDCVETTHQLTGQPLFIPMGSLANRHGRVIAEHIIGGNARFPGAVGAFFVKLFDINVGSVGLSTAAAERAGLATKAVWGTFPDKPDYYPESKVVCLKMIYEPETSRVLGLQAVGAGDICRRIDSMSALLQAKATLEEVLTFEHGYAPPYSEALDPLHHLAAMAQSAGRGVSFLPPNTSLNTDGRAVWLDVREPAEIEHQPWPLPDSAVLLTIPLDSLRGRLEEIPRDKTINLICKRGPRSYQASVILTQAGFEDVHILSGGYQAAQA
jgi:NADPH-dependent 2,4-dienoyl-CoA reductase/sulfur reductase-like enzyme/rhodanese-related sulfurtransferase